MSYYKKQQDNSISVGETIHGLEFTLDETTKDQSFDGWKWFDLPEEAYNYFSTTDSVSPRQFRLSLLQNGINPNIITDMLQNNDAALIEWEYSINISRTHPLVSQLGITLGKTDQQIDDIFKQAKEL
jgi:hypothetical protein